MRDPWFDAYLDDVVTRAALRPIADLRDEVALRRVLRLLAARSAGELVLADLARDAEIARETASTYVRLLEGLHLVRVLPAWATSATTRAKRHPKVVVADVGLAVALTATSHATLTDPSAGGADLGRLLETFVIGEVTKQSGWADRSVQLQHFRDRNGAEVDLIVEDRHTGEVAGVEVKARATPRPSDARHLARLRDALGVPLPYRDRVAPGLTGSPARRPAVGHADGHHRPFPLKAPDDRSSGQLSLDEWAPFVRSPRRRPRSGHRHGDPRSGRACIRSERGLVAADEAGRSLRGLRLVG